ncbi:hypothetical protein ACOMHN_023219 [Nucella lapillus]
MPRRGRSSPMFGRRPAPAPAPFPRRPMSTTPAHAPPAAPAAAAPRQPGLFGQMAATATGVAVGSVVGHTIGNSMSGGSGAYQQDAAAAPPEQQQQQQEQQQNYPCQRELQQFLDCAQNQADISLCAGFNEALRQCKVQFGVRP